MTTQGFTEKCMWLAVYKTLHSITDTKLRLKIKELSRTYIDSSGESSFCLFYAIIIRAHFVSPSTFKEASSSVAP